MGFEPTTASLEGWNSTTELRPPLFSLEVLRLEFANSFRTQDSTLHYSALTCSVWWAGKDSNLGRHKPADLQSAPFGHLGTCPRCVIVLHPNQIAAQV